MSAGRVGKERIRLLVDLTNPAILLYKEEVPIEKFSRNNYLEIISHLQSYKLAFTDSKVWIAITKKLETLLHRVGTVPISVISKAMHLAHLEDLLLYISSSEDETDYCFHSLEILSLMLREQSPQVLASAAQARSTSEKEQDVK
ncbi:hypothetical protein IscW_ISCW012753 [Ixodes scapularis]|uniref:Timeless N-terminal domain-containing protein n=1 Tax=Ixodes scapularis TaxID=6945 RepID=B7QB49_IXOSC|nr:hypothetical protein IscW_ISCW012753 [Ixodes scapularis]|eukprot:XP_002412775.1 hypothetical protein IscW_ISCW012753 [Ixodes scapularis]